MKPQELAEEIMKAIGTSDTVTANAALDIARALVDYNRFHPDLSKSTPLDYGAGYAKFIRPTLSTV